MIIPGVRYVQGRNERAPETHKYAIAIHNTSNKAAAKNEAAYATRREDGIGAHLYADGDEVIQSIDTRWYCWHAGSGNGNRNAVAIEITGVNSWTRPQWIANVAWDKVGAALAHVCRSYGIPVRRCSVTEMRANPRCRGIYSHDDMRRAWGGTTHNDPGPNFPWDVLMESIDKHLNPPPTPTIEGDDEVDAETKAAIMRIDQRLTTMFYGMDKNTFPEDKDHVAYDNEENKLKAQLDRIEQAVTKKDGV